MGDKCEKCSIEQKYHRVTGGTAYACDHYGGTGQRFRCNMISSITNRGRSAFMIFRQRFTARVFLNFLNRLMRLTRKIRRKVSVIVDGYPVHKARSVSRWLAEHHE
jgi:hypothetical protein